MAGAAAQDLEAIGYKSSVRQSTAGAAAHADTEAARRPQTRAAGNGAAKVARTGAFLQS
jgi:hypothetical protein